LLSSSSQQQQQALAGPSSGMMVLSRNLLEMPTQSIQKKMRDTSPGRHAKLAGAAVRSGRKKGNDLASLQLTDRHDPAIPLVRAAHERLFVAGGSGPETQVVDGQGITPQPQFMAPRQTAGPRTTLPVSTSVPAAAPS
jgi:hypothetical protein